MSERVIIQTKDRVMLVGAFRGVPGATRVVLLLHMMPADRHSYEVFQEVLAQRDIASLAIDFRGHGESTKQNGRTIDYHTFGEAEHQASIEDIDAAVTWLAHRGFLPERTALVGASIGANLALRFAADHPEIPAVVLLSPGEDYHGVRAYPAALALAPSQALWAAGSQGDDQESFVAAKWIVDSAPSASKLFRLYTAAGHGTQLFQNDATLLETLAEWLATNIK